MSDKTVPIVRAKTTFFVAQRGKQVKVARGSTAHADHPIVHGREQLFEPFKVDFSTEVGPVAASSAGSRSRLRGKPAATKPAATKPAPAPKAETKPEENVPGDVGTSATDKPEADTDNGNASASSISHLTLKSSTTA